MDMLSKIGSICGKPLYCDKCISAKMKLGYARILVEMDSFEDFLETIAMVDEQGVEFQEKAVYEWFPSVCSNCRKFGHLKRDCRNEKSKKIVWRMKNNVPHDLEDGYTSKEPVLEKKLIEGVVNGTGNADQCDEVGGLGETWN